MSSINTSQRTSPDWRMHLKIVDCGRNGPATAVAWQTTGRPRSGVGRRHAASGPVLTPQCPCAAMRPPSQVASHNLGAHPDRNGPLLCTACCRRGSPCLSWTHRRSGGYVMVAEQGPAARSRTRARKRRKWPETARYAHQRGVEGFVAACGDLNDQSLTDYVLSRAREAAQRDIREHEVLTLSVRDSARFADLLLNPPEPNEHLVSAARRHDELISS